MIYLYTKFHWPEYGSLAITIQIKATHTYVHCHYLVLLHFKEYITLTKVAHFLKNYYHAQFQGPGITDAFLMSAGGLGHGFSALVCFVFSGFGDVKITRSEDSYQMCVCVCV